MSYYFSKKLEIPFDEAVIAVKNALAQKGFGVLTEIDVRAVLKMKLNVDFRNYVILGSCHAPSAYRALTVEDKIGTMLPCNVIVQDAPEGGGVEVAAVDPVASMQAVDNPKLAEVAREVRVKLKELIEDL